MTAPISKPRIGAAHRICLESDPMNKILKSLGALAIVCAAAPAMAAIDCSGLSVGPIYTGDSGSVEVTFTNGGSAWLYASDANTKNILGNAGLAKALGMTVTVRYSGAGSCATAQRTDVVGMYIN